MRAYVVFISLDCATSRTCRMAALEFRYGLEVQQTSVQKQTNLLCPFPFQFSHGGQAHTWRHSPTGLPSTSSFFITCVLHTIGTVPVHWAGHFQC